MTYATSRSNNQSNQHYIRNNYNITLLRNFKQHIADATDTTLPVSKEIRQYTYLCNAFSRAYLIK